MVHVSVDTHPITVQMKSERVEAVIKRGKTEIPDVHYVYGLGVYLNDELIYATPGIRYGPDADEDDLKSEYRNLFDKFLAEQFKEWLKTNGPGTQAEE